MAARKSRIEIAESEDWLLNSARTLSELLEEISKAASMCAVTAHSATKRIEQLPHEPLTAFPLIRRLERYRSAAEELNSVATQAAKRGDLVVATAAALKLGRLFATVMAVRDNLGVRVGQEKAKRTRSEKSRERGSHRPIKKPGVTKEEILKWMRGWSRRNRRTRGAKAAAAVHFGLSPSTITRRLNEP